MSYRGILHVSRGSCAKSVCSRGGLQAEVSIPESSLAKSVCPRDALLAEVSSRGSQAKSVRPRSALQEKSVCAWVEQQRV